MVGEAGKFRSVGRAAWAELSCRPGDVILLFVTLATEKQEDVRSQLRASGS